MSNFECSGHAIECSLRRLRKPRPRFGRRNVGAHCNAWPVVLTKRAQACKLRPQLRLSLIIDRQRGHPMFVRCSVLLVLLGAAGLASAQEMPYFITYTHHMEEPGSLEIAVNPVFGV